MNVLKNFEALFVVALGLACAANYALDSTVAGSTAAPAAHVAAALPSATPGMQVVVVSAKRLSAAEKAQSLAQERKANTKG